MTLKNSARNSSMPASPKNPSFVSFTSEKSQFLSGGPVRLLRRRCPTGQSSSNNLSAQVQYSSAASRTWRG